MLDSFEDVEDGYLETSSKGIYDFVGASTRAFKLKL
jgi:hypothetical protein